MQRDFSRSGRTRFNTVLAVITLIVVAIVVLGIVSIRTLPDVAREGAEGTGKGLAHVLEKIFPPTSNVFITQVLEARPECSLHAATWTGDLSLKKTESSLWTRAEVKVAKKATVPLYVPLKREGWRITANGDHLIVHAPAITYGTTAVLNNTLTETVMDTSWRISEDRMLRDAKRELDDHAEAMAHEQARSAITKARSGVAEFVRNWVQKQPEMAGQQLPLENITVVFEGEPLPETMASPR